MYFTADSPRAFGLPIYKTVLCVACVLILIVNGISLFHNLQSLKGANALLSQTARVADRLQYLNVLVMDAESSTRGYFISGSESYLGPFKTAMNDLDGEFRELDTLLADNPSQLTNLKQLRVLVNRKLSLINQAIDVYKQGGLADILRIAQTSDARASMDEIRLQVVIMVREQHDLLSARNAAFYQEYQKAVALGIGINGVAIIVIAMFYRLIRRSFFIRAATERALQSANENLESMVTRRTEQLSVLSRHLISVSEEEKAKLARELHDELGANLTAINMHLAFVAGQLKEQPELADMLKRARATLLDTVELKRRLVENLRPSLLDNLGLSAALRSYCEEFTALSKVRCEIDIQGDVDAPVSTVAIAVFRIVQESLTNILKYARANQVLVRLKRTPTGLALQINDDGIGIDPAAMVKPMSHGLLGMRERALLLGGTLTIKRGANDIGTCIEAFIPLADQSGKAHPGSGGAPAPVIRADVAVAAFSSVPHPSAGGHIPTSPPCSTPQHSAPGLGGPAR